MTNEKTANFENKHLKAWQLIIELIKHPFKEVTFGGWHITNIRYNGYAKVHTLDSINTNPVRPKNVDKPHESWT
mgnify:CR=1 FL=1